MVSDSKNKALVTAKTNRFFSPCCLGSLHSLLNSSSIFGHPTPLDTFFCLFWEISTVSVQAPQGRGQELELPDSFAARAQAPAGSTKHTHICEPLAQKVVTQEADTCGPSCQDRGPSGDLWCPGIAAQAGGSVSMGLCGVSVWRLHGNSPAVWVRGLGVA